MINKYIIDDNTYKVGLYIRLSKEDGDDVESESVSNQRSMLLRFITELGSNFELVDTYIDDGYSGLNFNRPNFQRMIKDIETKKINMVVTKDLSRLGRDYIETGRHIEKYFPEHGVRYIAMNDSIDTFNDHCEGSDLMPFRLGMNDMYAKDISKKVRSHLISMKKDGLFASSTAPYGYIKNPQDKHKLILDLEAAPIVKKIFDLYIAGYGTKEIADLLTREKVPTPIVQKKMIGRIQRADHPEIWKDKSIMNILKNQVYLGRLIQHTSQNLNYKTKKRKKIPKSEWIIVENTHEPIIDEYTFELASRLRNKSNTYTKDRRNVEYILSNLVFCKDCGARMSISYEKKRDRISMNCNTYRKFSRHNICFSHYINYEKLEKLIYDKIRLLSSNLNSEDFENILFKNKQDPVEPLNQLINNTKAKIEKLEQRMDNLYYDKESGIITLDRFKRMSENTQKEIDDLKETIIDYEEEKKKLLNIKEEIVDYKFIVNSFLKMKNPTKEMINKIIKKIYITKDKKIEIHYGIRSFNNILA